MRHGSAGDAGTWLVGGAASICLAAMLMVLVILLSAGLSPFWPAPLVELQLRDGAA